MYLTGYHYTSYEAWKKISHQGLKPQLITTEGIAKNTKGIWLWAFEPEGKHNVTNILYQVTNKGYFNIVKLEVEYQPKYLLKSTCSHEFIMGDTALDFDIALIYTKPIPRNRIKIRQKYDLLKLLK